MGQRMLGLLGVLLWVGLVIGTAQAAPEQAALAQAKQSLRDSFQAQVDQADSAITAGRLEGSGLAQAYRQRGVGRSHLGQYQGAVADFTRAIELDGFNPLLYQDRAIAHLRSRDYARANTDLDMVLGLDRDNFGGLREKGRVAFYQGDFALAARYFLQSSKVTNSEGQIYAALWANVAAQRGGQAAPLRLQASNQKSRERWPMPVGDLLLGEIGPERVLELADSANAGTFLALQCEAHFYLGQYHLIQGRKDAARASFQAAVDTGKADFMEYDWALRELESLH